MAAAQPPEYLPLPAGFTARVAELTAAGTDPATAAWMAAGEALGAVGRRETNDAALFWHGEAPDEQREAWDRIADREGARFYWHQRKDTLVGYLACRLQKARASRDMLGKLYESERRKRLGARAAALPQDPEAPGTAADSPQGAAAAPGGEPGSRPAAGTRG